MTLEVPIRAPVDVPPGMHQDGTTAHFTGGEIRPVDCPVLDARYPDHGGRQAR